MQTKFNHNQNINFYKITMIRSAVSLVRKSAFKPSPLQKIPNIRLFLKRQQMFSEQKPEAPKEALGQSQPAQKKLTDMDFEQLIELKTEESLSVAEKKVEQQEKKVAANQMKLEEMAEQSEYLEKHAEQIKQKELKLVENIEEQEKELKRVKVRAEKEVDDSKKYSITKLAKQLLEAADCINRCKNEAVKQYPDSKDPFILGIVEAQKKLVQVLKTFEIEEFDPIGKQFDPNTSESLLQIPCPPGYTANTVATTMTTGYLIQGRLLRSARVGIFSQ